MVLTIDEHGNAYCVYSEVLNLAALGTVSIRRASYVEPDDKGNWSADLSPVAGPCLGPFDQRSQALEAERAWLESCWPFARSTNQ
jgi:hypothetical protein